MQQHCRRKAGLDVLEWTEALAQLVAEVGTDGRIFSDFGGWIEGDAGCNVGGHAGCNAGVDFERWIVLRTGRAERQMGARRMTQDDDPGGIEAELLGVGACPTDARLDVLELGRPERLVGETIRRGNGRVAERR